MARYAARKGVIYLSTTGSGVATSVLSMNQWTVNYATDDIDVTSFGDQNKVYVPGLPNLQGTFKGFWDDLESKPFTAATSVDGCNLYLYPSADTPTKYWYGPAWLDCTMDCSVAGAVTLGGSFAARGSWGKFL